MPALPPGAGAGGQVAVVAGTRPLRTAARHALATASACPLVAAAGLDVPHIDAALLQHRLDAALRALEDVAAESHDDGGDPVLPLQLARTVAGVAAARLVERAETASCGVAARAGALSVTIHELRRPLTIVSSYGQLLEEGVLGTIPDSALPALQEIATATETMRRLVDALSEVGRLEDPDDEPLRDEVAVADVVAAAVAQVDGEAGIHGARLEVRQTEGLLVHGDHARLVLALTNLLSNALKHTPAGGVVRLRTWCDDEGVHLSVRDQGPGFPADEGRRLFEKYYRAAEERMNGIPGTGLGLYIVRTVAERHGGAVTACNLDPGAEFALLLPPA